MCYIFYLLLFNIVVYCFFFFFFQAEDGIRDRNVTGVQTCVLPISQQAVGGRGQAQGCEAHGRLLKFSVCWDAAVCAVSVGGFFSVWDRVCKRRSGDPSFRPDSPRAFFECDCGEEARASSVLAPAEGRLQVAKYDVAIIGSGPGGYVAAIRAGELGLKTVVVEKDPYLGGTCLHVGCIPTKVLLHHAEVYDQFKNGAELGFEVSGLKINWANVLSRKDKIVKKHSKGIEF